VIAIPGAFAMWIGKINGREGDDWLSQLPDLVNGTADLWNLAIDGPVAHGAAGIAVPVTQNGQPRMLKIAFQSEANRFEAPALAHWDGRGMVQVFEHDVATGAMLLERLGPASLDTLDWRESIAIAGDLIRLSSVPGLPGLPTVSHTASEIDRHLDRRWIETDKPVPSRFIEQVHHVIAEQRADTTDCMVNKDLHFENVLAGHRMPWIAIDPMPFTGPPEFGFAQLLWRVLDRLTATTELRYAFDTLVSHGNMDSAKARDWTLVRLVDYWLWALEYGLTEDPVRCATVIDWSGY
jgi:streptomycin 6-kinase